MGPNAPMSELHLATCLLLHPFFCPIRGTESLSQMLRQPPLDIQWGVEVHTIPALYDALACRMCLGQMARRLRQCGHVFRGSALMTCLRDATTMQVDRREEPSEGCCSAAFRGETSQQKHAADRRELRLQCL